jgi:hypothetical protein
VIINEIVDNLAANTNNPDWLFGEETIDGCPMQLRSGR